MIDTCICCGSYVPEGRMVCPRCEIGPDLSPVRRAPSPGKADSPSAPSNEEKKRGENVSEN